MDSKIQKTILAIKKTELEIARTNLAIKEIDLAAALVTLSSNRTEHRTGRVKHATQVVLLLAAIVGVIGAVAAILVRLQAVHYPPRDAHADPATVPTQDRSSVAESLGDGLQAPVAGNELPACRSAADARRRAAKRPLLTRPARVNALDRRRLLAGRWRRVEARRAHDRLY